MKSIYRKLLMGIGILCVALGTIGAMLPIMPTVPFLLVAAACFDRSSPRFHQALVSHVHFGPMIRDFYEGRGIPRRAKRISLIMIWSSCAFSFAVISALWIKVGLVIIFTGVTLYLLYLKTSDQPGPSERPDES